MIDYSAGSVYVKKPMLSFMLANLIRAVESYAKTEAFTRRHPNVDRSSAKRADVLGRPGLLMSWRVISARESRSRLTTT